MAFKMKGSPAKMGTIQGTAGHSSALKMKAASALKQDPYAEAKARDPKLDEYIKTQKSTTPGSDEYEANQKLINKAYNKTRDQELKKKQIAKVEEEKKAKSEDTKTKTSEGGGEEKKKKKGKLSKLVSNIFSKEGKEKRLASQREKNKGTKYEGMTMFEKQQAKKAEARKPKM